MMRLAQYTLALFASYSLARIITVEDGPFDIGTKMRTAVLSTEEEGWLQRGILCPICVSFWASFFTAALLPFKSVKLYLLESLGFGGMMAFYFRRYHR